MRKFYVLIPVRFHSTRLPGKALLDIAGKPMLQHVYERAKASGATDVIIATDDSRIEKAAQDFGAKVCMTSAKHKNGTDRLAETVTKLGYKDDAIIVNVQSDEPLIPPVIIKQVALDLASHSSVDVATLCEPIKNTEQLFNPDLTKVVMDRLGYALYFSHASIPWDREQFSLPLAKITLTAKCFYRHIGLYAYRVGFLKHYINWSSCALETLEHLEQLRMLWNGVKIHVAVAKKRSPIGVDTEQDLETVRKMVSFSLK